MIPVAINQDLFMFYLPTSVDSIPNELLKRGCNKYNGRSIHAFHFPQQEIVTSNGFDVAKNTFIYLQRNNLHTANRDKFLTKYSRRILKKGELDPLVQDALKSCILNCPVAPRKVKKFLLPF